MGIYTQFKDGYARETVAYGTSAIVQATQTYLWGVISQTAVHPSPRTTINYRATGVNAQEVPAGYAWKSIFELTGMYPVGLQNAIPIWAVMGKSATTGPVSGVYTHTITPPDDGAALPSFTIQHEKTGTATAWSTQFTGCKVAGLTLTCGQEQKYLIARMDWMARTAADPAFQLTNNPILPPTATTAPYKFAGMSRTFDGGDLDGLQYMEFSILPDLAPLRAHRWDGATYTGQWLYDIVDGPRKQYSLTMDITPEHDDLWDELIASGNTKDIVFTWTKSTNDYIAMTLSDCHVIAHELNTPEVGQSLLERVEIEPERVSFVVKDTIAGGYYGE